MGSLMIRIVLAVVATTVLAFFARTEGVSAHELATAEGPISIAAAPAGMRSPRCSELVVEARDANDNHLIAETHPETAADGVCKYALSVPAQSAVFLHLREALVSSESLPAERQGASAAGADSSLAAARAGRVPSARSVQIRWTVISPNTYFFAPGEQKTIPLNF
jgi:hypothetical protein